jgi:hypothetical protein
MRDVDGNFCNGNGQLLPETGEQYAAQIARERASVRPAVEVEAEDKRAYVSITHGMRGYFAVLLTWDEECGCHTPWNSGFGSFATSEAAHPEAKAWAESEGIEFRP